MNRAEDSITALVFLPSMQEANRLIEAIVSNSPQKGGRDSGGIANRNSSPNKNSSNEELNGIFDDKGFEVKQYGMFRMKHDRVVRYTPTYELGIYKTASDSNHKFQSSVPLREIEDIKPKVPGSRKLIISYKNPKKFKNTKLMFKDAEQGQKFISSFGKLMTVAVNSKSAVLVSKKFEAYEIIFSIILVGEQPKRW